MTLRFTIRDVLWLTVAVGLFLAWGIVQVKYLALVNEHHSLQQRLDTLVQIMRSRGYEVHANAYSGVGMTSKPVNPPDDKRAALPKP